MAAEKRGIYFGRMLNLLVSTFRPRTERDFPSNRDPDGAKNRPGGGIFASGLPVFSLASEGIRQNFSHGLRRFLLGRCGDVGIGV